MMIWCRLTVRQSILSSSHRFWTVSRSCRELLVQSSVEDLQSRQDAGNFTVSPRRQRQPLENERKNLTTCNMHPPTGDVTCSGSCRSSWWASSTGGGPRGCSEAAQCPGWWRSWSSLVWPPDAPLISCGDTSPTYTLEASRYPDRLRCCRSSCWRRHVTYLTEGFKIDFSLTFFENARYVFKAPLKLFTLLDLTWLDCLRYFRFCYVKKLFLGNKQNPFKFRKHVCFSGPAPRSGKDKSRVAPRYVQRSDSRPSTWWRSRTEPLHVLLVIRQLDNGGRTWTCPCAAASSRGGRAETCTPAQRSWAHCLWRRWWKSSWVEAAAGDDWVLQSRDTKDVQDYNLIFNLA